MNNRTANLIKLTEIHSEPTLKIIERIKEIRDKIALNGDEMQTVNGREVGVEGYKLELWEQRLEERRALSAREIFEHQKVLMNFALEAIGKVRNEITELMLPSIVDVDARVEEIGLTEGESTSEYGESLKKLNPYMLEIFDKYEGKIMKRLIC
jgi:hypothetical protein